MNSPISQEDILRIKDVNTPFNEALIITFDWIAMFIGYMVLVLVVIWLIVTPIYHLVRKIKSEM